jgi:uncharacterized protein (TIGR02099 family)
MSSSTPLKTAAAPVRRPGSFGASPWRWLARRLVWLLLAAWTVLLLAWLTLHWGILPRIEQWRGPIELRASQALGVPVRIGGIAVRSSGWVPSFELRDVALLGADQRPALLLPRVAAAVSLRSLLSRQPHFEQLLIEGAQLEVRRDALGRIFVAGLEMAGTGGDGSAADWFFSQREFAITGGSVRWTDETRLAPTLQLRDVQLVVRNGLRQHSLRIDATPDEAWGDRFTLRGRFTQPLLARPGDWRRWSGTAYAELPRADVRELRRHVELPFELSEGDGALRGWVDLEGGRPRAATVDVALRAVSLRLATAVEPLTVEQLQGRVIARSDAQGGSIGVQRLGFVTGDGVRWPAGDLQFTWRQREGQAFEGGEFSAQQLDLGLMAQIAGRVPLGEALRRLLAEVNPQGQASGLSLRWDGAIDAPHRYTARGLLTGLSLSSLPSAEPHAVGRPGLRNATLQLSATEAGGQAQLGIDRGAVELPGVFDDPLLPLERFSAQLAWTIERAAGGSAPPRVSVQLRQAKFANADAQGEFEARWSTGPGEGQGKGGRLPGLLELDGKIGRASALRVARYLPLGIPEETRTYLGRAIRGGTLASATFRVKGDLWDFPFYAARSAAEGEFRVAARAEDVSFAYVPSVPAGGGEPAWASPWPALTRAHADVVIDRATLSIRDGRARVEGMELSGVQGGIASLHEGSVLSMQGAARGSAAELLKFIDATPVGSWTGRALSQTTGTGTTELKLALNIPLTNIAASTVTGSVVLPGNDIRITPETPLLGGARGRVEFTQKGFAIVGATARVLGGEASFDGGSVPAGGLRFNGSGVVTAEGLRRATEIPVLARAAQALSGQTPYRVTLGFVGGWPEISVSSTLLGMGIDLPVPLRKTADTALPLVYQTTLSADAASGGLAPRDLLRLELGTVLQAQYQRELGPGAPKVLRGAIGVFEPAPLPAAGVSAAVTLPMLQADQWLAAGERLLGGAAGDGLAAGGYAPQRVALRARELVAGSRRLDRVVAGISSEAGAWRANVDADQLSGYVEWRPAVANAGSRVFARLARLSLPPSDVEQVEALLDQSSASVPALDIVVDDFELRGKRLGRLEVEAAYRAPSATGAADTGREWALSKLNLTMPEARLAASGQWLPPAAAGGRRRAQMNFKLELANSGALLERLGSGRVIRGGKGEIGGQVSWLGSPLSPEFASMTGQMSVAIESGQFLKADAGAGRLLGVLSLQSLPRRLALDFRDVFQEGFAFDAIAGDVKVAQGVAQTNNLRMRGVQAAVLMEGSADLSRETQDLRVFVVPEINAGTASLAYAAINPAVGIGTFVAQMILRRPLIAAGTREFRITGPWAEPNVERVERKPGDPVPEIEATPSPAAPAASATARPGQ